MEEELGAAEHRLLEALRGNDRAALEALLCDDFLITTAGWISEPVGKSTWLDALSAGHTVETFDLRITHTRPLGAGAVVLCESTQSGTRDGAPWELTFRYTDVWKREDDRWRLAVRHASGVRPA